MFTGRSPLFILDRDIQVLTGEIIREAESVGLGTLCSFDLDFLGSRNGECYCPVHGAAECTCKLVILSIWQKEQGSVTLILESRDHRTYVYLCSKVGDEEESVDVQLIGVLLHVFMRRMDYCHE